MLQLGIELTSVQFPLGGTLIQDALSAKLPWPWQPPLQKLMSEPLMDKNTMEGCELIQQRLDLEKRISISNTWLEGNESLSF